VLWAGAGVATLEAVVAVEAMVEATLVEVALVAEETLVAEEPPPQNANKIQPTHQKDTQKKTSGKKTNSLTKP